MRKSKHGPCYLEFGTIYAINLNGTVRVLFPSQANLISWWLKMAVPNTQNNKDWNPPDIGEMVACLMDEHLEKGVVIGSVYSTVDQPPSGASLNNWIKAFSDGAMLKYDRSAHALTVTLPTGGTADITAPGGLTVNATSGVTVNASGGVTVNASGGVTVTAADGVTVNANVQINGNIVSSGTITGTTVNGTTDVETGSISLKNHVHGGVSEGTDDTDPPTG